MSYLKGEEGRVCFTQSGTPNVDSNQVLGTTSWSISISKDLLDITRQGQWQKRNIGSFIGAEGSVTILYDNESNAPRDHFIADILVQGDDAQFSLYPKGTDGTHCLNFKGIVTGCESGATVGEIGEITMSYIATGEISTSLVG